MENRTVLVTGATDGIGKETALQLARMGANVLIHGRNEDKGAKVLEELKLNAGEGKFSFYKADFSSLAEVKHMADEIKRNQAKLHVLINNAGNLYKERKISADGYEMTFAVNYLAPFLLTQLLLDLLKLSAPARIVNVASSAHMSVKNVDLDNLQGERGYNPFTAYSLSKLGNVLFSQSLAKKLAGTGVTVNSLHPGVVATKLLRKSYDMDGISMAEGARTSVYLASSHEVEGVTGKYFQNQRERLASEISQNKKLQDSFWNISLEMIGKFLN